ncbi:MAG: hypothetical protein RBR41_05575 [Desulfovibrio sp.]|uniref:hypothetical protein n=1 Tax=Desulfovibrio sp. TaxID=885 RepID=UPI002A36DBEF|nr:hypothetical protein [Desulfovibrio sp.]MDY0259119.1 hypothetical protein [Desulfovibrio sp.]
MFFIGGLGFLGVAFAFIVGFFPLHNLTIGNQALYVGPGCRWTIHISGHAASYSGF